MARLRLVLVSVNKSRSSFFLFNSRFFVFVDSLLLFPVLISFCVMSISSFPPLFSVLHLFEIIFDVGVSVDFGSACKLW